MANRNYPSQRVYSMRHMMVQLDCGITIGATGAVSSFSGNGISAVTRLAQGLYQVQLQDNYNGVISVAASMQAPAIGSAVTAGSFSVGTPYKIVTLGTTNYNAIGLPAGLVAAIGMTFVATAVGAGTGTAQAIGASGISSIERLNANTAMLNNQPFVAGAGGFIQIQTLAPTSSSVTTPIASNPVSGSVVRLVILLNNSSVDVG